MSPTLNSPPIMSRALEPWPLPSQGGRASGRDSQSQPQFGEITGNYIASRHVLDFCDLLPKPEAGNLSLSEISGKCLQASINAIQIYYAVKTHQHVWERVGTVGLQLALGWFIINKITDSSNSGLSAGVLNYGMEDRQLAGLKLLRAPDTRETPFWQLHKKVGREFADWFNETVQRPLQKHIGMNGDFRSDVFLPATLPFKTDWNSFRGNEIDWVKGQLNIYEGKLINSSLRQHFEDFRQDVASIEEVQKELADEVKDQLGKLVRWLRPDETLADRGKDHLKAYIQEAGYGGEFKQEAQQRLTTRMTRLFHLYDHLPFGQPATIETWIQEHIAQDKVDPKKLNDHFADYLAKASDHWTQAAESPIQGSVDLLRGALVDLVSKTKNLTLTQAIDQQITLKQTELAHVHQGFQVAGTLIDTLNPLLRLNERIGLMRGFLDRRNNFSLVQVALLMGITAAIQGKALLWIVFHTFARLDPDFDPTKLTKKQNKTTSPPAKTVQATGSLQQASVPSNGFHADAQRPLPTSAPVGGLPSQETKSSPVLSSTVGRPLYPPALMTHRQADMLQVQPHVIPKAMTPVTAAPIHTIAGPGLQQEATS